MRTLTQHLEVVNLGYMVLDKVITDDGELNSINKKLSQSEIKLGGPPAFSAIIRYSLSRVLPWINPHILVYAYTCPKAQHRLRRMGVSPSILENLVEITNCPEFNLIYRSSNSEREIYLSNVPETFNPRLFNWKKGLYNAIIVGSVYQEFNDGAIFDLLANHTNFIAFDPQGCFRKIVDETGKIELQTWWDSSILSRVNCLKLSESEAFHLGKKTDLKGIINRLLTKHVEIILITRGNKGAWVGFKTSSGHETYSVPAFTKGNVVDETGAGDVFLSMFVYHYLTFNDILNAASFATSIASLLIEKKGIDGNFSEKEITSRMKFIRSKIKKII